MAITRKHISNQIRYHRRKSGLSQREISEILGFSAPDFVARHEASLRIPALETALGYEIVFRVSVAELFPGIREQVNNLVESRLARLEERLGARSATKSDAAITARKLLWIAERRNQQLESQL